VEDVVLVEEEMCRTIEYGYWVASEWEKQGVAHVAGVEEELLEGLKAYAREQVTCEKKICASLTTMALIGVGSGNKGMYIWQVKWCQEWR
jgi:hypothetical protein